MKQLLPSPKILRRGCRTTASLRSKFLNMVSVQTEQSLYIPSFSGKPRKHADYVASASSVHSPAESYTLRIQLNRGTKDTHLSHGYKILRNETLLWALDADGKGRKEYKLSDSVDEVFFRRGKRLSIESLSNNIKEHYFGPPAEPWITSFLAVYFNFREARIPWEKTAIITADSKNKRTKVFVRWWFGMSSFCEVSCVLDHEKVVKTDFGLNLTKREHLFNLIDVICQKRHAQDVHP
ncbi:hypothetical protein IE53DRAFT_386513 [Violaceomyces palustris]|uniref:Uncharacterized protein n=1 Tax=Violaceomyces palustris TaxID=1673888 RepID=A0ACD0NZC9_9BASI|nr:hypothetical protein IE53DRAFT_386513 [Violaceomyces palustris]